MALNSSPGVKLTPTATKEILNSNYLEASDFDFTTQNLPELYEKEFARYGNQSLKGFLEKMGQEMAIQSDLIKWSEEGRLRPVGTGVTRVAAVFTLVAHPFRLNDTVILNDGTVEMKGIVTAITADTFTVAASTSAGFGTAGTTGALSDGLSGRPTINVFTYSNEYRKGTNGRAESLEATPDIFENKPIIIKELDEVNGSDMAQVGWIEVEGEGGSGYLWYLKSRAQSRQRFDDYIEMGMVEGVSFESGSAAATAGYTGTEGFFEAVAQGNVFSGVISTMSDVDEILSRLNKQGAISEYMMMNDFEQDRAIDYLLAAQNSYGVGGTSYGAFNNSEDTALNLGFSGFKVAGYEIYKSQWKYLDDPTARGLFTGNSAINAVMCPSGTKTVRDEVLGANATLPFLHVKYRKSGTEDRRYKVWQTGSAGGANNSDLDANQMHMLTERALCTMGRNNFVLVKG
jgi:hypothetical protein